MSVGAVAAPAQHGHHRCTPCDKGWGRVHHWHRKNAAPLGTSGLEPGVASWYDDSGPTACNSHYAQGVANLTLPCGSRVRICHSGCEVATVEDRGPYVGGRVLDLNPGAKEAIGCPDMCDVRWSPL